MNRLRKVHEKGLSEPHFTNVEKGLKTVEGRPITSRTDILNVGDTIVFKNSDDETRNVKVKITGKTNYPDFKTLLEFEGLIHTLPDAKSLQEGIDLYKKFYPEVKNGVVAIIIQTI